jgi:hypothetical protein
VYAKNHEGNGRVILIRIVRYSLDGNRLSFFYAAMFTKNHSGLVLAQV